MGKQKQKTAIVTGGTKGIGAAIVAEFVKNGLLVVIGAREDNGFAKTIGSQVRFLSMDVRRESDHQKLVKTALDWTQRLDIYINCAGFSGWRPILEVDEKFFQGMIDVNLKGAFWGCKVAAQHLRRGGCIINISSLAGKRGSANNSVYCASKFGLIGLTQALAKELGPRGIRVNAVCPVYVKTPGVLAALQNKDSPAQGRDVEKYLDAFSEQNVPLGRLPLDQEIAKTCFFLASEAASAITGQSINVDCGVLPQ